MEVTIGGNRLGSGNKMQTELNHYQRSTHNLSKKFASSLAVGTLVPCYVNVGLPADSWEIDINTLVRTLPTNGPLFGSFKLQVDCFMIPFRLYQGILHNNAVNIGMKMNQVYLPTLKVTSYKGNAVNPNADSIVSYSSLLRYLGISGSKVVDQNHLTNEVSRDFNAIATLGYYDIYKNYYANKQEGKGVIISGSKIDENITHCKYSNPFAAEPLVWQKGEEKTFTQNNLWPGFHFVGSISPAALVITIGTKTYTAAELMELGWVTFKPDIHGQGFWLYWKELNLPSYKMTFGTNAKLVKESISLVTFDLENIDLMRQYCLSKNKLGDKATFSEFLSQNGNLYPYLAIEKIDQNARCMNGLAIKTYQSDMFNNWLNSDWIEGENSIQALTSIDTSSGEFNIDTLNLAQKLYNLFNRIAVSGGTYNDWRDAVYTDGKRLIESPIYCGGMSAEIGFEEVVGTAQTDSNGNVNHIGQLAGKGTQVDKQGGKLTINCDEPCIIMAIASITPRLMYSNGNKWFNTDIITMDDLHKPALDGIGFQDLITEQMDWREAQQKIGAKTLTRYSAGKLPAWINYMTDVDECFGDFADPLKCGFMVLGRNYEVDGNSRIKDLTTYIDPQKFNYAFADASLAAQNFWVQVGFDIKKRGLISAKIIPSI